MKKKCSYANCKNEVVGEIEVDIDLPHFAFCKKHKQNVSNAVIWAIIGAMELSNAELGLDKPKTRFKVPRAKMKK